MVDLVLNIKHFVQPVKFFEGKGENLRAVQLVVEDFIAKDWVLCKELL